MKKPWMKFYPADWRSDEALRSCSIAARGLWVEMMALMHVAEPVGSLLIKGKRPDKRQIASLSGISEKECIALMIELEGMAVFSRDADGTIYSRRMRRDAEKAIVDKENGSSGGNPKLKVGVNPHNKGSDKAQKLEARNQKEDSEANASGADAPPDPSEPERQFFARGKERGALGPSSGGQLAKLLKTCGGNVALARSKLELAITKEKPGEFIAGILRAGIQVPTGKPLTQHQIERQTTRDILDELDSFDSRSGQADPGLLRHDSGGRSAGVHGGVRRDVVQISASSRRAGD